MKIGLCGAAALLAIHSFALTETVDGITWTYGTEVHDGETTAILTWYAIPPSTSGSISIPSTLGGYPVTSIGEGAFYGSCLTSVIIPDSVTGIGVCAFQGCPYLESVTIPKSVTSIGLEAFSGCSALTNAVILGNVTNFGAGAFRGCESLASVTIGDGVTAIGDDAFSDCYVLADLTIGSSVTNIGSYAFRYCRGLTSVTIPSSVTQVGLNAFDGTVALYTAQLRALVDSDGVLGGYVRPKSAGSGGSQCACSSGYAISDTIGNSTITSMTVSGDTAIDSFLLADGKVFDMAIRIVNTADHAVSLTLPAGYTYETIKDTAPLTIPANSTNIVTITRTADKVFLVAREELSVVQ